MDVTGDAVTCEAREGVVSAREGSAPGAGWPQLGCFVP